MAQEKKFGTFSGVFTPSILTILGVIMYMRLPWIIGQAGIFTTIGIILIAHIVSVTTGLSVSSIATDKKVKAGGTYFIISRSLGLPIGGTLGIALFFGLSLSVSLYIIGFSESFLAFWDFPVTKDTIRLAGTIAILFVGTLTFISTSLAIKTQYFIMAAIFLSLISILFGNTNFAPEAPLFKSVDNMEPLIFLFAIFFPAVTGFEAGVSMSGDLKDPKKSIPLGTISAIVVGLFTYIGLTIFFGYRVNADALVNNPNILLDISFYAPLVVAGIWGATMSSAIGSILGAPRILQATSSDRITPKIFAKGYGKTNEPRNALILTFIVAEAGILIGELNLIARVVSMFFITTYGFLNLSSALESWASTDFRPSFKIPAWISITGSLVCFILMLELDFAALIGATLIMGAIFLYLKRKELTLESGDTWEGVWSSVLRTGLNRLTRIKKQQRNWRPNIILFSGDSNARPHLLEFGRWLVHKRGILSNFNLVENKNAGHLIPQPSQSAGEDSDEFQGIFMRSMEVNDVYEGMETITKVYGFAGIEPNSVMLGWGRNSKEPEKFGRLIHNYSRLDYNIFVLDYAQEYGFGQMKTIDVWWRGGSNSVNLALTLLKFLQASPEWHQARARIFIVSDDSALNNKIYKNMIGLLEEQRIDALVKIINNAIEHKPVSDIIKLESMESDLVILGLPEVNPENSAALIHNVDAIISDLRTVLLIRASSFFKPIYIGIERQTALPARESVNQNIPDIVPAALEQPGHDVLAARFKQISELIEQAFLDYQSGCLRSLQNYNETLLESIGKLILKSVSDTKEILEIKETHRGIRQIAHIQSTFLFNLKKLVQNYKTVIIPEQKDILLGGTEQLLSRLDNIQKEIPEVLNVFFERQNDNGQSGFVKRLFKRNKAIKRKIRLYDIFNYSRRVLERKGIYEYLKEFGISSYQLNSEIQKLFNNMNDVMQAWTSAIRKDSFDKKTFEAEKQKILQRMNEIKSASLSKSHTMLINLYETLHHSLQSVVRDLDSTPNNRKLRRKIKIARKQPALFEKVNDTVEYLERNQQLISNFFIEDLLLKGIADRIGTIAGRMQTDVMISIDSNFKTRLQELLKDLQTINPAETGKLILPQTIDIALEYRTLISNLHRDIQNAVQDLPDELDVMSEESFQKIEQDQFSDVTTVTVNLRRYMEFLAETELIDPLQQAISLLSSELEKTNEIAREVVRFINYNFASQDEHREQSYESLHSAVESGIERLQERIVFLEKMQEKLKTDFQKSISALLEKMNPLLVSRASGELKHTIRTQESRKYLGKIRLFSENSRAFLRSLLVKIVYQRSEGVLFAKKLSTDQSYQSTVGQLVETIHQLTPDQDILNRLPFYYKQLFIGKRQLNKEFILERAFEQQQAAQAISSYKQGYLGALLILGERHSGKSTLSISIARKHFDKNKIFQLFPPESGTSDLKDFKTQINSLLPYSGDDTNLLENIPQNSAVIIHDLEMWWERHENGFINLDEITKLIDRHSKNCFFILNCGIHGFNFINRVKPLKDMFIKILECQPFDAEDIQTAIMLRHESSGLKFKLGAIPEENLSNLRMARLFNRFFDLSGGNIGQALYFWISSIQNFQQNILDIEPVAETAGSIFANLETDWIVLLQQFILHKHLSLQRIEKISGTLQNKVENTLYSLRRNNLIIESQQDIFCINPYIHTILVRHFKEMDVL